MAFLWLRSRANQKPHKANSSLFLDEASASRRALCAKRERHRGGACEFALKIRSVACGISNARGRKSRYRDTGRTLLWYDIVSTGSPAAGGRARFMPPAGYWVRWRRPSERAHTRCAVHSDHAERWRGPRAERRRGSRAERWRGPRAEGRRPPRQRATAVRPRPPGPGVRLRLRARWVPSPARGPRAGVNSPGVSLGGPRGHGAICRRYPSW